VVAAIKFYRKQWTLQLTDNRHADRQTDRQTDFKVTLLLH